jgi:adenylyltransferase/sulfurtransferase
VAVVEVASELSGEEVKRYSRHLILPEVGWDGQRKLKQSSVLCIGAGGFGSPAAMYLAPAGIGRIGIVDFDVVDYSNLQRQLLHATPDVGRSKLASAKDKLNALNPHVHPVRGPGIGLRHQGRAVLPLPLSGAATAG